MYPIQYHYMSKVPSESHFSMTFSYKPFNPGVHLEPYTVNDPIHDRILPSVGLTLDSHGARISDQFHHRIQRLHVGSTAPGWYLVHLVQEPYYRTNLPGTWYIRYS